MPPPDTLLDLPDFLRRLSTMMTGGRNAEMAALAATEIEALMTECVLGDGISSLSPAREDAHPSLAPSSTPAQIFDLDDKNAAGTALIAAIL